MVIYRQFLRYVVVGLGSNLTLYLGYLFLTYIGMGHKTAMTLLYAAGTSLTFVFNRNWTFRHHGHISRGFIRYSIMYAAGYFVDLTGLYLLVDIAGYPHQIIQLLIAILLAMVFFVLMRSWVFSNKQNETPGSISGQGTP